ncbi:tetratricopeptide repeat protein [Paraburkholderia diazotrophica]|uniref:protein O-GlcNAc transferase n=1 Tax=Paraburkholderia diazotrophica TaxID=667676 RepID=A0A1H7CXG4_9BURK|nr:tetratricopeptide repeat protein [Paraburkholderia diazotrophica]SEJ94358.1 Predicted O-linked N-acetylglucosamine transferase, SPINDLY family [Paraburkholderia diazotrophica]
MSEVERIADIPASIEQALGHHRAGRFDAARSLYEDVLRADPQQPDALHFLGLLACQLHRTDVGVKLIEQSLAVRPDAIYYNNFGNVLADLGRFDEAIVSYKSALGLRFNYPEAHNNLGNALRQAKQPDASMRACAEAIRLQPGYAEAYNNLGNALHDMGELDEALASYCKAIELNPEYAVAYNNVGNVLREQDKPELAIDLFRKAVALQPNLWAAHHSLCLLLRERGELADALASLRQALSPEDVEARNTLACVLRDTGDLDGAESECREVLLISPEFADAHCTLASVLCGLGRHEDALKSCGRAIELDPEHQPSYRGLGLIYYHLERQPAAILSLRHALELSPRDDHAWLMLANALREDRQLDEALEAVNKSLSIGEKSAAKYLSLGDILQARGAIEEGLEMHVKALELGCDPIETYARLLFTMPGSPRYSALDMREHAVRYGQLAAAGAKPFTHAPSSYDGKRPLRIGFVSGDLRGHPVGIFLESIMGHLDRTRIDPIAYVTFNKKNDAITARLKPHFSAWHSIEKLSTLEAAEKIRDDNLDILIDLSGHTAFTALPVFAWRPAPLQVSWLGFFATTGCEFIDYFIGDPHTLPQSEEHHFVEKAWRLPDSYLCFTPPDNAPDVGPLPMERNGFVTFGYFGKLIKVTDDVVALWARVLHRVPDSKLFLKAIGLGSDYLQIKTIERFARHGIDASRLILEGESSRVEYLEAYNRLDIALSPFPYGGGTTTAEGLWMGAPVLGLKGDRFLTHICESLLHAAGLGEWVAADKDAYVEKAVAFASDPDRLAALRAGLREQTRLSPMCDAPRFANNLVDAFHRMWELHLNTRSAV